MRTESAIWSEKSQHNRGQPRQSYRWCWTCEISNFFPSAFNLHGHWLLNKLITSPTKLPIVHFNYIVNNLLSRLECFGAHMISTTRCKFIAITSNEPSLFDSCLDLSTLWVYCLSIILLLNEDTIAWLFLPGKSTWLHYLQVSLGRVLLHHNALQLYSMQVFIVCALCKYV